MADNTAEVLEFKGGKPAATTAPAIGISFVANLPGDRQVTTQCFVAQEEGEAAANALLDKMRRVVDRARAFYELDDLRVELIKQQQTLSQFEEDKARLDHEHEVAQAKRRVEMNTFNTDAEEKWQASYNDFTGRGGRGEFFPKGHEKSKIEMLRQAAVNMQAEIDKADAERKVAIDNIEISRKRFAESVRLMQQREADIKMRISAGLPEPDGA